MNLILYINLVPHLKISNQLVKDLPFFEIFILQNLTVRLDIYIILFFTKRLLQTSEVAIYIQKSKSQSLESIRDSQGKKKKKWIAAEVELQKKEDPIPIILLLMETPFLPMMCAWNSSVTSKNSLVASRMLAFFFFSLLLFYNFSFFLIQHPHLLY